MDIDKNILLELLEAQSGISDIFTRPPSMDVFFEYCSYAETGRRLSDQASVFAKEVRTKFSKTIPLDELSIRILRLPCLPAEGDDFV